MNLQLHTKHPVILYFVHGYEAISALYYFDLDIDALGEKLDPKNWLHENLSFQVQDQVFHGEVFCFTELSVNSCRLRIMPSVANLNHDLHSRIYQKKTVIEIVGGLIKHYKVDFSKLSKNYREREHCVQYQETDWAFIQRLLAEEGISYYFKFYPDQHMLVLMDQIATQVYEKPLYHACEKEEGYLLEWVEHVKHGANHFVSVDYNPRFPQQSLELIHYFPSKNIGDFEYKYYPGGYDCYARGEELIRYRVEASLQAQNFSKARSRYQDLHPYLMVHLYQEPSQAYLITELWHEAEDFSYCNLSELKSPNYVNKFKVIRQGFFRSLIPAKKLISSVQVATVIGGELQAPAADLNGDINIVFSWDEEKRGLAARIAQPWSGSQLGVQFFPRVGDKVLVYFINGDPERPIIWGALTDVDQPPLYDLSTRGIRTHNQERFNELRFDAENAVMSWHAARDFVIEVGRDAKVQMQNSSMQITEGDATIKIGEMCEINASESIEFRSGNSVLKITPDKIILAASVIHFD